MRGAMVDAAGALRAELHALTERVGRAVYGAVPALAADADVRRARERSGEANIADLLALLADPVDSSVPPDALELATLLVRRGADPGDLVHAYLVGQNELWRAWMEELSRRLPSGPELIAAVEQSSARIFSRAEFLVTEVMRHVERERERWAGGANARRGALLRSLLAGQEGDGEASRALGYELDGWVLAAVLWDGGGNRGDRIGRAQQILGRPLDADRGRLELALAALERLGPRAGGQP